MSDLVAFLRARLDEDERVAQNERVWFGPYPETIGEFEGHLVIQQERVLREVQMKRTLLSWMVSPATGKPLPLLIGRSAAELGRGNGTVIPETWILREIAAVYSDHPDYDPAWATV